ncbi:hypothetical protein A3849_00045 [Paenibacillus sp. P46E]|nr:hypothetical protein A3849_00045 [Paenibacillus sp. P46E]
MAVRTLKTGRRKADFGVRGQSRRGRPLTAAQGDRLIMVRDFTDIGDNQGGTAIIIVPEFIQGRFFVFNNYETGAVHDESK